MSQQIINTGASPNDGQGDPIRTAFIKTNSNFATLFALPNPTPPTTLIGKAGDVPGMYAYNSSYFYYCFGTWNGTSTIWAQVSQINSVSVNKINNGNSNVSIGGANANVTITVNSIANIATFSTIGLSVTGNITGNYFIGDGSQLINLPAGNYSNANVANFIPTYSGNIGSLTAIGNVKTVSFFVGDGSQLSNINAANLVGAYSNANVANYLPTFSGNITANTISLTGNITANVVYANDLVSEYIYGQDGNIILITDNTNLELAWIISSNPTIVGANNSTLFTPVSDDIHVGAIQFQGSTGTGLISYVGPNNGNISNTFSILSTSANILFGMNNGNSAYANAMIYDTTGNLSLPGNLSAIGNITSTIINTIPVPLANLTAVLGSRAFITDANLIAAGNFGSQVSSGGSNVVPVWSDGANWYIG